LGSTGRPEHEIIARMAIFALGCLGGAYFWLLARAVGVSIKDGQRLDPAITSATG